MEPDPYWEEALKRDPGDVRVNTALGILISKRARFEDAEKYLRKAIERLTDKYTSPKDGEAFYYLGVALKAQGKNDEAYEQFLQGHLERGLAGGRILFAGRNRLLAGRSASGLGFFRPLT